MPVTVKKLISYKSFTSLPIMAQAVVADKSESKGKKANKNKKALAALYEPERCERCGAIVIETHCKVLCTNCGFMRDCNDQW